MLLIESWSFRQGFHRAMLQSSPRRKWFSLPSPAPGIEPLRLMTSIDLLIVVVRASLSARFFQRLTNPVVSQLLLFKKPHLGISGGLFCDLFSLLSSRFSLRSSLFSLLSPPVSLLSSLSALFPLLSSRSALFPLLSLLVSSQIPLRTCPFELRIRPSITLPIHSTLCLTIPLLCHLLISQIALRSAIPPAQVRNKPCQAVAVVQATSCGCHALGPPHLTRACLSPVASLCVLFSFFLGADSFRCHAELFSLFSARFPLLS